MPAVPIRAAVAAAVLMLTLSGCAGSADVTTNPADRTFLQDMISHHGRAIEVGRLAATDGDDARVRAFGRRIVREQTPELRRLNALAQSSHLHVDAADGARMATNRITDAELDALRGLTGRAFDRRFLTLSVASEQGAAAMARTDLAHGRNATAHALARAIARAPHSEIPQLQALLSRLP